MEINELKILLKRRIKNTFIYRRLLLWHCKRMSNKNLDQVERYNSKRYRKRAAEINVGKHRKINWEKPTAYTEKVNYSKIYAATQEKGRLTDKYAVREWVASKIGEEHLVPLVGKGVYDSVDEIDFNALPDQFVLKCTHDSGSVLICRDKKKFSINKAKRALKFYLKRNHAYSTCEMHYRDIPPRIISEKYMGGELRDYKFWCFHGKPCYLWVDFDRFKNHKRNFYDMEWNLQPFNEHNHGNYLGKAEKPEQFEEMIEIAKALSEGFDHVRVDLFIAEGKVYFGEMTFTNGSGLEFVTPQEWDGKLGELWNLDLTLRDRYKDNRNIKLKDMVITEEMDK